jgi:CDP-diacylglycerol--glycerol-3-phosphate 3-phosphatidyltransferase
MPDARLIAGGRRGAGSPGGLTAATWVTIGRGVLVLGVGACALAAPPPRLGVFPLAGVLYAAAALADVLDGWLARRRGEVTPFGARLDVEVDAAGLLVGSIVGARAGALPPWYLVLGGAYYVFKAARWARGRLGLPTYPERLRPYALARGFAAAQMATVALALLEIVPPPAAWVLASAVMVPTLVLMTREWRALTASRHPSPADASPPGPGGSRRARPGGA